MIDARHHYPLAHALLDGIETPRGEYAFHFAGRRYSVGAEWLARLDATLSNVADVALGELRDAGALPAFRVNVRGA